MVVKVFGSYKSACTLRVLACLAEKDVEYELVKLGLDAGEHKKPDFLMRQPFGQVPAVEDGDFKLFESRAIIRYYATKYAEKGPNLLGKTLEEQAVVDQWLEVEAHNYNDLVFNIVLNTYILPHLGLAGDMAQVEKSTKKLGEVLDIYEKRLGESSYLAGEFFTLADLTHLPGTYYLITEAGMGHLIEGRKNVKAWWENISSRPAWKKLVAFI